jgi:hypothetical protein
MTTPTDPGRTLASLGKPNDVAYLIACPFLVYIHLLLFVLLLGSDVGVFLLDPSDRLGDRGDLALADLQCPSA